MAILESAQFVIDKLIITSNNGKAQYDVIGAFDELNIFDAITIPCMSGNILIRDSVGLSSKIKFDGSEYLEIKILKDPDRPDLMWFDKRFVIYKQSERKAVNQSSETYILHFVSEEFILSKQKKIRKSYKGTYSDIVKTILTEHLKIENKSGNIGILDQTKGLHEHMITNLSPFDAIEQITKRSINTEGLPNYVFYQTQAGYNFTSLSTLNSMDPIAEIEFGAKNISGQKNIVNDVYGARDVRVSSQFNLAENIQSGVYAGKFIGYDTLTRTLVTRNISFSDVYKDGKHSNSNSINTNIPNKENKPANVMYDSRVTLYPFQLMRTTNDYLKTTDPVATNNIDDTHNYIFQRKAIFANLFQKKLRVTMPGNFRLWSGSNVILNLPNRFNAINETEGDQSVQGKYIIVAARHIIRYDRHETILEVATDSTNLRV